MAALNQIEGFVKDYITMDCCIFPTIAIVVNFGETSFELIVVSGKILVFTILIVGIGYFYK